MALYMYAWYLAKLTMTVRAIEIYRPEVEPQSFYHSEHQLFAYTSDFWFDGTIRYVKSGYPGHLNDAQQFWLRKHFGNLPEELCLLADKICPNHGQILISLNVRSLYPLSNGTEFECQIRQSHIWKHIKFLLQFGDVQEIYCHLLFNCVHL